MGERRNESYYVIKSLMIKTKIINHKTFINDN